MKECPPDRTKIAHRLLAYLSGHPHASDTLEGISRWWLTDGTSSRDSILLKEVLDDLVVQGLIEKNKGSDQQLYYRSRPKGTGKAT